MLEELIGIVKAAGNIILSADNIQNDIESKEGKANFVTKYDVEVQNFLYKELKLRYPEAAFIGEEDENKEDSGAEYCFIIDPIDGTTNFIYDYHHSAVSVGVMHQGEIVMGVVYNPYLDEVFYAKKGEGAFLNGQPLKVKPLSLEEGIVCFGTAPYYREHADKTFQLVRSLFDKTLDIRRSGSSALDVCNVAANRFVLFFEMVLSPWDYAASSLILTEAGGCISTMEKETLKFDSRTSVIAATPKAYDEFFKVMKSTDVESYIG